MGVLINVKKVKRARYRYSQCKYVTTVRVLCTRDDPTNPSRPSAAVNNVLLYLFVYVEPRSDQKKHLSHTCVADNVGDKSKKRFRNLSPVNFCFSSDSGHFANVLAISSNQMLSIYQHILMPRFSRPTDVIMFKKSIIKSLPIYFVFAGKLR